MIRTIAWSDDADRGLSRALSNPIIRGIVAQEVRAKVSTLWECRSDVHHAYVVTRLDLNPMEWVIVAFEGSGLHVFGPEFASAAKDRGLRLRVHTASPVVVRLIRKLKLGVDLCEYVMRSAA